MEIIFNSGAFRIIIGPVQPSPGDGGAAMKLEDRYGLKLSTTSDAAASAYCEGVDLMLSAWTGATDAFDRAIAADPDFALPLIARARMHTIYQQGDMARKLAATASRRSRKEPGPRKICR